MAGLSHGANPPSKLILNIDSNMEFEIEFDIEFDFGFNFGGGSEPLYMFVVMKFYL